MSTAVWAQPAVGSMAPELSLNTADNNTIHLSSLKGRVVLIDFWASWCAPCRKSNRQLVGIYNQYKAKGFEILGVSIDSNYNDWLSAIKQDKITWLQVRDTKDVANEWKISYVPMTYLLDTTGKIIAIEPSENELKKLLNQYL
jgi:peroxiredoxin